MTSFRRYVVSDLSDGLHISARKHPLDVDGTEKWMLDAIEENYNIKRNPVTVWREPLSFQLESHDKKGTISKRRFSLVNYYGLVNEIAEQLLRDWTPPDKGDDDEYIDKGPPELRMWRGIREWAVNRTEMAINKMIYDKWKKLRETADPVALTVQKKVFAATFGYGSTRLVMAPEFYKHPFIVKDVLEFRAAAVAAGLCGRIAYTKEGIDDALGYMADWRSIFSLTKAAYPSLNKTLTNLPYGIPARLLLSLNQFMLRRPVTSRLELLTIILAHRRGQRNIRVFEFATEAQIAEVMQRVSAHLHRDLSPRRWKDLDSVILFLKDYPDQHTGNLVGLAERSIRWHRDFQNQTVAKFIEGFGHDKDVAKPPIPLPSIEGIRFLSTVGDVAQEGVEMQHCISTYAKKAVEGHCYLFHVDHQGRQASVEVDCYGRVIQANGPRNESNAACEWGRKVLGKWGRSLKKALPPRDESV